jgi:hypothetical protein
MSSDLVLQKVTSKTAVEVCEPIRLGPETAALLRPDQSPAQFLRALVDGRHWDDAIRLMAYALPKRDTVWWGCLCVRLAAPPAPPTLAALRTTVRWVVAPEESHRLACKEAAAHAGQNTPAGLLGQAAFYSGGSITAPGMPAVAPKPTLTARFASGAVLLAAASGKSSTIETKYRQFVGLAIAIANGKFGWRR